MGKILKNIEQSIINEMSKRLDELSVSAKQKAIEKFSKEKPELGLNVITHYVTRFEQLQNSPHITQKDIFQYNWKDLEKAIDSAPVKKSKADKPPEPGKDANLIYNENGLRIYKGHTKQACIKYGTGYSWCISARGEGNMYSSYRFDEGGTPYFVFDDDRSHELEPPPNPEVFIDPLHAIVIFVFEKGGNSDGMDYDYTEYMVTTANNDGEETFRDWDGRFGLVDKMGLPKLRNLQNLFTSESPNSQESKEHKITFEYNHRLYKLNSEYLDDYDYKYRIAKTSIEDVNVKKLENILNGTTKITKVSLDINTSYPENDFDSMSQVFYYKTDEELQQYIDQFVNMVRLDTLLTNDDFTIIKEYIPTDERVKEYYIAVKDLYLQYKNELNKAQINESIEPQNNTQAIVDDFVDFVCELIEIKDKPKIQILDKSMTNGDQPSFGGYNPSDHTIMVCFGKRHTLDALRTLAHEMVHYKQNENGDINVEDGKTGSGIENEANSSAGIIMREYGKLHPELF